MSTAASKIAREVEAFRHQAEIIDDALRRNVEDLTHEESLTQPHPGGNCLNWVVGHLLWTYTYNLPVLGQEPVMGEAVLKRYARGTSPLRYPDGALDFQKLMTAWKETVERIDAGIANLTADALGQPVQHIPGDDPSETVRQRVTGVLFHQSYHVGQTGLLRRIAGKEGAIQ